MATSTFTLRGRRGAWRHRRAFCVAGVALGDIDVHSALQAWHLWHWAGSGGALGSRLSPWAPRLLAWQALHLAALTVTLRGRRGTSRHRTPLCVAGVALMALGWLWWRAPGALPFGAVGALAVGVAGVALGGIDSLCVAGVALMALDWLWWRAWFPFGAVGAAAVCVAGVALGDIDRQFAWQVGVAGVALRGIDRHFAWQVWHFATSTPLCVAGVALIGTGLALVARLVPVWRRGRRRCLRGRRGTWRSMSLCLAGVALGDNFANFAWQAWHLATLTSTLHGRRGTYGTGLALVVRLVPVWRRGRRVAGVAFGDMTVALHVRPGTWRHRPPLCVAGVALMALGWLWWRAWFPVCRVHCLCSCCFWFISSKCICFNEGCRND